MYNYGKIIKVGTRILISTFKDSLLKVEEYSNGGTLSSVPEVTTITCNHSDSITGGNYFIINSPSNSYLIWFRKDNAGKQPYVKYTTLVPVDIYTDNTAAQVATAVAAKINALGDFTATASSQVVTVTNTYGGEVQDPLPGDSMFAFNVTTQGTKKILFNGTLGKDVDQVLDLLVATDGSAEILVTTKVSRTTARGLSADVTTQRVPTYLKTDAGWLFA